MSRFEETETALMEWLRALKAKPEMTINMFDISVPLSAVGFTQDKIKIVLDALEQDKLVAYSPGNLLAILKKLPRP
jgi:hypothetical protein